MGAENRHRRVHRTILWPDRATLPDRRGRRMGHAAMFRLDQIIEFGDFEDGAGKGVAPKRQLAGRAISRTLPDACEPSLP